MSASIHEREHDAVSGHCGHNHSSAPSEHGTIVRDPVCGMNVDTRNAAPQPPTCRYRYYFCSAGCLDKFKADPDRYLNSPAHDPALRAQAWRPAASRRRARSGPARCIPRSGATVRAAARSAEWRWSRSSRSLDEGPNPELIDMTRRFWLSAAFTLPLVLLVDGSGAARLGAAADARLHLGRSSRWRRRWCCGAAGRSSSAAGRRS